MNAPLVSILINNYNYASFLKEAIESALNQTYPLIEVIVVDDGSIDNSKEIIASFGDRIKPILKQNGGQASAFNAGFTASVGEIICFLDSDDLFKPQKIATVVKDFKENSEIDWYFHSLEFFGKNSENSEQEANLNSLDLSGVYDLTSYVKSGKLRGCLPFELSVATSGMCFQRLLLKKILPMPEEIRITSDDYIKYAALGTSKGFISFQTLGRQRIHGNNAYTSSPTIENGVLRAKIQVLTADNLRKKFPQLSRFSDNLVAMSIKMSWWIGGTEVELLNLIGGYLTTTNFLNKLKIYVKAVYYRIIDFFADISNEISQRSSLPTFFDPKKETH
jgi:glycosyltransferase involved in cell wall biosynthesis